MKLMLDQLLLHHPALRGHPIDYAKSGALAFARAGHVSPTSAKLKHDSVETSVSVEWSPPMPDNLSALDSNRVTEDGAETVALSYANVSASWVVKRRLQRGESADWLLQNKSGWLALEVSGMIGGNPRARLTEKKKQVAQCSLPANRLAVVVAFDAPLILAGNV